MESLNSTKIHSSIHLLALYSSTILLKSSHKYPTVADNTKYSFSTKDNQDDWISPHNSSKLPITGLVMLNSLMKFRQMDVIGMMSVLCVGHNMLDMSRDAIHVFTLGDERMGLLKWTMVLPTAATFCKTPKYWLMLRGSSTRWISLGQSYDTHPVTSTDRWREQRIGIEIKSPAAFNLKFKKYYKIK